MKRTLLLPLFILSFSVYAKGQVQSQRVVFTSASPPTACVPGKIYTNPGLSPARSWIGTSAGTCTRTDAGAATATPGGSDTQVQFNDGGSTFGGDAGLVYNKTTDTLSIAGGLNMSGVDGAGYIQLRQQFAANPSASILGPRLFADANYFFGWKNSSNSSGKAVTIDDSLLSADRAYKLPDAAVILAGSASALTSGRVPIVTTGGVLADDADMTFSVDTLTVTKGVITNSFTLNAAPLTIMGSISGAGIFGTSGIRIKGTPGTLTDTTSSGTVATSYTDVLGGNTIAATSATTVTNWFSMYVNQPVAGTNVTLTNKWAIGADSLKVGTSNPLTVTAAGVLTAISPVLTTPSLGVASGTSLALGGATIGTDALGVTGTVSISSTTTIAGQIAATKAGALSSSTGPGFTATGTWITGGSATTTKPYVLIEPTGATSAFWNTAGTGLGLNAPSGFTGDLINTGLNGSSKFSVTSTGAVTAATGYTAAGGGFTASTFGAFGITSRFQMNAAAGDGVLTIFNAAGTDFSRLQFGGTTSSFPAIKRSSAGLSARLADDSADTSITLSAAIATDFTNTTGGTTGAQTINKRNGSVNFAAAATSLVVTNSTVTTASIIQCTIGTNDTTMKSVQCVAASGSFTIFSNAAATAETRVYFTVLN